MLKLILRSLVCIAFPTGSFTFAQAPAATAAAADRYGARLPKPLQMSHDGSSTRDP
ncbi:MAG TPA: hypothetical protein VGI46_21470 [Candidatus Acidoferrum sp.]|jgi:hypothetical protein